MKAFPLHDRFEDLLGASTRYLTASQLKELSDHSGQLDMAVADYGDALQAYQRFKDDPTSFTTAEAHRVALAIQDTSAEVHRLITVAAMPLASMLAEVRLDQTLVNAAKKTWQQAIKKVGIATGDFKSGISLKDAADQGVYIQAINNSPVVRQAFVNWQREARDNRTPSELQGRAARIASEAIPKYWSYCDVNAISISRILGDAQTQGESYVISK